MARREEHATLSDRQVDEIIGNLLRSGVILAAAVVALGGIWYLAQYGTTMPNYHVFHGEPANLRSLRAIISGLADFNCRGIIQFGLLLLIATPVARVAFSVAAFGLQRDRTYVAITLFVLAVLLFTLLDIR